MHYSSQRQNGPFTCNHYRRYSPCGGGPKCSGAPQVALVLDYHFMRPISMLLWTTRQNQPAVRSLFSMQA
jgi:hypothetical protein